MNKMNKPKGYIEVQSRNSVLHFVMCFSRFPRHFFGMQPGLFLTTAWCCSIARVEGWSSARLVVGFSGDFLERDACVAGTAALSCSQKLPEIPRAIFSLSEQLQIYW